MSASRRVRSTAGPAVAIVALMIATALTGCTTDTNGPARAETADAVDTADTAPATVPSRVTGSVRSGPVLTWTPLKLPAGLEARTLTTLRDRLLVGALKAGNPPSPAMLTVDPTGSTSPVPVTPASPYGHEARWYSVATDGARVIAIGGANGGAHANVRWTTWSGSADGVGELPQSFYTFGGWGAGDLVEAVITPAGDALVGSWGGAQAGLDAAVWTFAGNTWTRQDPAGTALQSTADALAGPRGATADADGLLISGSTLHLGGGAVRQTASVWRSSGVNTGWRRLDLPEAGQHSEAVSASCFGSHSTEHPEGVCVVAGQVDGVLAGWSLDPDQAVRLRGIPVLPVGDQDAVPAPLRSGSTTVLVSPAADGTAVVSDILGPDAATAVWARSPGPSGRPLAAALVGDRLYVATREQAGGPTTLWSSRWPG